VEVELDGEEAAALPLRAGLERWGGKEPIK
jgi:hypothetical protein